REVQVSKLLTTLEQRGQFENFVFSGDFNLYGASEPAYQKLRYYDNTLFAFYDPLDKEGEWHNNGLFADLHTQSTHAQYESGSCFASGGLDDRFDFILVSPFVYYGSYGVTSLNDSYHAVGQDGSRFNRDINNPSNTILPANVANALFNASDHLPVVMDLAIDATTSIFDNNRKELLLNVVNPIREKLSLTIHTEEEGDYNFQVFSLDGRCLQSFDYSLHTGANKIERPFPFSSSLYILIVSDSKGNKTARKIVK
ncbi:T9SS type A sorting domain-containing protein, partial [Bacteroidales bacterium OttesenSCG-928-A14]|nr:T9SS type A sorting domain-containing protein [Bacteroidales bacterium OttesenSCG-928-A14]